MILWIGSFGFAIGWASAAGASPAARDLSPTTTPEDAPATNAFAIAVSLYKNAKADEAVDLFQAVAQESGSPNAHLYVGLCRIRQQRYAEAHDAFTATVRKIAERNDDKYEATREAAEAQLSWLSARVAKLVILPTELPPRLVTTIDGRKLSSRDLGAELVLTPGQHLVEATADGVAPVFRRVELQGGQSKLIALAFQKIRTTRSAPAPGPAPPVPNAEENSSGGTYRALGLAAGGVGVVGLAVFAVAGLKAKGTYEELGRDCPDGKCASARDDRLNRGKSEQTIANIGLAAGLIGTATAAVSLYLGISGSGRSEASVAITPKRASVAYQLRF